MGSAEIYRILLLLSMGTALAFWMRIPAPRQPAFRVVGLLIGAGTLVELIGAALALHSVNNNALYNGYTLVDCLLALWICYLLVPERALVVGIGAALVVGAMAWDFFDQGADPHLFLDRGIVLSAVVLTLVLMAVLWQLAQTSAVPLHQVPGFWLFMGLLIYFGCMSPILTIIDRVYAQDHALAQRLYQIMPVLCITRYAITAFACKLERGTAHG